MAELDISDFSINSINDARIYLEWSQTDFYKFIIDLIKRQLDLSVISLGKFDDKMSFEDIGKSTLLFHGEKRAYQRLVALLDQLKSDSESIIKNEQPKEH